MSIKRILQILWPIVVVATLVLAAANIWFGELNQDEGWYLYAGRMVAEGQLPFIDFASTQGPVMAFVYAVAWPLVDFCGVLGGRIFTALLGLLATAGAAWLAYRMMLVDSKTKDRSGVASVAALMTFVFIGINVYQSYFFVIVKTYALAGLFLVCSFLALSFCKGSRGYLLAFLSGVFMSLAVATRLSAIAVIPAVLLVYIIYILRGKGDSSHLKTAIWVAVGALLTGLLVFLPFLIKAPEATLFGLVEYHAGRKSGGLFKVLAYKAGFVARLLNVYFVALGALLVGGLVAWLTKKRVYSAWSPLYMALGAAVAAVTLLHFIAAFPYDDYQVMLFPLLSVFLSIFLIRLLSLFTVLRTEVKYSPLMVLLLVVFVLNMVAAFASPLIQDWFIGERDRIWWPFKEKSSLAILRETADEMKKGLASDDLLLTQDTYLAVEIGVRVPHGLELGPFSYFPNWPREKTDACHVLNRTTLIELLEEAKAPMAALSGYSFAIGCPEIKELPVQEQVVLWEILERNYELSYTVERFGQAGTQLELFLRK